MYDGCENHMVVRALLSRSCLMLSARAPSLPFSSPPQPRLHEYIQDQGAPETAEHNLVGQPSSWPVRSKSLRDHTLFWLTAYMSCYYFHFVPFVTTAGLAPAILFFSISLLLLLEHSSVAGSRISIQHYHDSETTSAHQAYSLRDHEYAPVCI